MAELNLVWGSLLLLMAAIHAQDVTNRGAVVDVGGELVKPSPQEENERTGRWIVTCFAVF